MIRQSRWALAAVLIFTFAATEAQIRPVLVPFPPYPGDEDLAAMEINEDQAFFDAANSQLVIVRAAGGGIGKGLHATKVRLRVDLGDRVAPSLAVEVTRESPEGWLYRYTVGNASRASLPIESWLLEIPEPRSPDPLDPLDQAFPVDRSGVWEFGHYAPRPGAWVVQWSRRGRRPVLTPGSTMSDFLIEADRKPGFLTAHFQGGREPLRIPEDLPEKLERRLRHFFEITEGSVPVLTVGPKFRPDESLRAIAADFHVGISRLSRHGQMEADSPFVRACLNYLQSLVDEPAFDAANLAPDFQANPTNPLEESVYRALRLALDLRE